LTDKNFYFVSGEVSFQESDIKGALIEATVLELEKESEGPAHNVYKLDEGDAIAESLVGVPVYYGVDLFRRHDNPLVTGTEKEPVGIVEAARVVGNKIKATIRITAQNLVEKLRKGAKYLFSVGGIAISETTKKVGDKIVHVLLGAICNHLQIVDANVPVGFPNAKVERLIGINETVLVCEGEGCGDAEVSIEGEGGASVTGFEIERETVEREIEVEETDAPSRLDEVRTQVSQRKAKIQREFEEVKKFEYFHDKECKKRIIGAIRFPSTAGETSVKEIYLLNVTDDCRLFDLAWTAEDPDLKIIPSKNSSDPGELITLKFVFTPPKERTKGLNCNFTGTGKATIMVSSYS
jgi:hypothetical protein